ncbi:MAG TPA: hypothetical protein PLO51_04770, partial [Candidatus Micrarchaeota archaeon]|nr:hypothetical protein [Candidatus Micrarchaeota archaeon]
MESFPAVGIDGVPLYREVALNIDRDNFSFRTNLGVAITTENYNEFKKDYNAFFETFFSEYKIKRERKVYKMRELESIPEIKDEIAYDKIFHA